MLKKLSDHLRATEDRRKRDAHTYAKHDPDLCMLCHAYGDDKRSLHIDCFYDISEAIPEALDLFSVENEKGWYLRICKTCRGELLDLLREWRNARVGMRDVPKDHDGYPEDAPGTIPVRIDGYTVMMTDDQWHEYQRRRLLPPAE